MFIERLDLLNFRNIRQASLELSPGFNVFYGGNGQGKSNLLEAIHTLSFLKGFRTSGISDLVEFHAPKAQISAVVKASFATTRLSLELDRHARRAYIDGASCTRVKDYLGILRSILFVPSDVSFLQNAPADRRTSLDRMVFNLRPAYLLDLEQYNKISKQKSAVLHSDYPDQALLDVYDVQICPIAMRLIEARYDYLKLLSGYIRRVFASIFDSQFDCLLTYKLSSSKDPVIFGDGREPDKNSVIDEYLGAFRKARPVEIARRQMVVGPHRDDWSVMLNGHSAKAFASQGQQRSICLAIKLSEIECLKNEADIEPVFLLDDVSSELDPIRHKRLFEYLNAITAQTFLTTTAREHVHIDCVGRMFSVENGSFLHVD